MTLDGGVKIIDFGIAKAAGRAQHTRTGALKGKCSYMSPEQAAGERVDARADIFALGIVLHELLTGRRLFKADDDAQTLARVRECLVPPPSQIDPGIDPALDAIVLKALAKEPARRYASAQELRLALEEWLIEGRRSASTAHLAEFRRHPGESQGLVDLFFALAGNPLVAVDASLVGRGWDHRLGALMFLLFFGYLIVSEVRNTD